MANCTNSNSQTRLAKILEGAAHGISLEGPFLKKWNATKFVLLLKLLVDLQH